MKRNRSQPALTKDQRSHPKPEQGQWAFNACKEDILEILDNAPCGIVVNKTAFGEILYINQASFNLTGYALSDIPTGQAATSKFMSGPREIREAATKWKELSDAGGGTLVDRIVCNDGTVKICEIKTVVLRNGMVVSIWTDVTRREEAEKALLQMKEELENRIKERTSELTGLNGDLQRSREELRHFSEHMQRGWEEERTRIAREIHDELGHLLTGLKMDLANLGQNLPRRNTALVLEVAALEMVVKDAISAVREICSQLRPSGLDQFGLPAAIEWYLQGIEKKTGLRCTAKIDSELGELDKQFSLVLFHILQEVITNILCHAGATKVQVKLRKGIANLVLVAKDNGRGIRNGEITSPRSFGIMGIRERVRYYGGKSTFTGVANKGTTVIVSIPLDRSISSTEDAAAFAKRQRGETT